MNLPAVRLLFHFPFFGQHVRGSSQRPSKMSTPWRRAFVVLALFVLIAAGPGVYLLLRHPSTVAAAWFDTNWGFRQKIPITNTSGTSQTDFQAQVVIDTATLITAGKLQSSCNDIRFTSTVGKALPFWVEPTTCNTATTKMWVKVDSIPTATSGTAADIYFYYGNPNAAAASYTTSQVFIKDMQEATAAWPLDDTTAAQSYSRVVNPAVSTGRNMILNGSFDDSSSWTPGTGWAISGGVASATAAAVSATMLQGNSSLILGKAYQVTFTISNYSAGSIRPQVGNTGLGTNRSANGTYIETIIAAGNTNFTLNPQSTFTGSVDNVIVTEINIPATPNVAATELLADGNMEAVGTTSWPADNGATISKQTTLPHAGTQVLRVTSTSISGQAKVNTTVVAGNVYRFSGYMRGDGTNSPRIVGNSGATLLTGTSSTSWQPFDFLYVSTVTNDYIALRAFVSSGTGYAEFDDVSLTLDTSIRQGELAQDGSMEASGTTDWTAVNSATLSKQTGTPHGGTQVLRVTRNGANNPAAAQTIMALGKKYRVTGWARGDGTTSPNVRDGVDTVLWQGTTSTSWQSIDFIYISVNINIRLMAGLALSDPLYAEFDDISVTEVSPLVGIPTNGVTLGTAAGGHLTTGYTFDGTNDLVNIYSGSLNSAFNPNEGTMIAWAKVSGSSIWADATTRGIFRLRNGSNDSLSINKTSINTIRFDTAMGGNVNNISTTAVGGSTNWFQLVLTWSKSSDQIKAYVNGAQVGSTITGLGTWTTNLTSNTTLIGATDTTGSNPWSGLINDVRLYNRALSDTEISNLYNASYDIQAYTTGNYQGHELVRKYNDLVVVGTAATEEVGATPIGYWKFDDGTGTTTKDSSTNSNTGTLGGTPIPTWQTEGQCIVDKCLYFDGSTSKVTGSSVAKNIQSISFWIRPNTIATQGVINFDGGTHVISTNSSGVLSATGFTSPTYYINGTVTITPTLIQNQWNYVTITTGTSFNSTASFTVGTDGINFIKGTMDEVKFYNYVRTAVQVQSGFLQGAARAGSSVVQGFQPQSPLSNGLTGYWKLDEASGAGTTLADSSGNNNTGTAVLWGGSNTSTDSAHVQGKFANGFNFDGGDDYVSAANATSLQLSDQFTLSAWLKPSATGTIIIASKWNNTGANQRAYLWVTSSSKQRIFTSTNGSGAISATAASNTAWTTGVWNHLVVTKSGTTVTYYLNGKLDGTTTISASSIFNSTAELRMGMDYAGTSGSPFSGTMDDFRVYNRTLSPAEVTQLYNFAPGPSAYYKLDERTGVSANDSSGNSNTGTVENGTTWVAGKYGSGVNFDGVNDDVTIPSSPGKNDFDFNQDFTVNLWAKIPAAQTNLVNTANTILVKRVANPSYPYSIDFLNSTHGGGTANKINVSRYDGTHVPQITSTNTYNDNLFHYVSFSKSGATLSLYIDGKLDSTTTDTTTTTTTNSSAVFIGKRGDGVIPFTGVVDDVKIYTYARSPEQITEDMRGSIGAIGQVGGSASLTKPAAALAYWKFDEGYGTTTNDTGSVGSAANGTLTSMASPATSTSGWSNSGKINKALTFDGTDDFVDAGGESNFDFTSDFSLSLWMKASSSSGSSFRGVIGKFAGVGTSGWDLGLNTSTGKLRMTLRGSSNIDTGGVGNDMRDDTWHHVVVVNTPSSIVIYVDGKLINTTAGTWTSTTNNQDVYIGSRGLSTTPFMGQLDEVKIYNFALTQDQINNDLNFSSAITGGGVGVNEAANDLSDGAGNSPVAYWNLDEKTGTSANDSSGKNNTATLTSTNWTTGKYGSGLQIDPANTSATVSTPDSSSISLTTAGTIEAWVNPARIIPSDSGTTFFRNIVNKWNSGGSCDAATKGYIFDWNGTNASGGNLRLLLCNGTTSQTINAATPFPTANIWYHVVATWDNTTAKIYINGVQKTSNAQTVSNQDDSGTLRIGDGFGGANKLYRWDGKIDQVQIYNYARTAAQVVYDYSRGAPIGWWKMDECQGTTINDWSGSGNSGTLTVGSTGTQTQAGTCNTSGTAWANGASGKFNSSLNFDGTDDYVNAYSSNLANIFNVSEGTMSIWAKVSSSSIWSEGANRRLIRFGVDSGTNNVVEIQKTSGGAISGNYRAGGTTTTVIAPTSIQPLGWFMVTMTWSKSADQMKVYINGQQTGTTQVGLGSWNGGNLASSFVVFGAFSSGAGFWSGQMDDVRIFNYPLSAAQVKKLYNYGSSVFYGPASGSP